MQLPSRPVSVGFVSTYPPTVCGPASFTASLRSAMAGGRGSTSGLGVLRLVDRVDDGWGSGTVHVHRRGDPWSLRAAVRRLNHFDAVSIQHEFGIYAGADGREVLDVVDGLDVPAVTTLLCSRSTSPARSNAAAMCRASQTFASSDGSSE